VTPKLPAPWTTGDAFVLTKAARRAAAALNVSDVELAQLVGLSAADLQNPVALDPASEQGQRALLFVRLYRSLAALLGGDENAARAWFHGANRHLGVAPAKLVQTGEGLARATAYVERLARARDHVAIELRERIATLRAEGKEFPRTEDLRERLKEIGTPAGRARVEAVLPYPRFEAAPGRRGYLVRIEADGTRTLGRFVKKTWVPVADEPSDP
jgi:hypothetical protein